MSRLKNAIPAGRTHHNATGQTTPARMRGSHHRAIISAQQHWQAICHHGGARQLFKGCHAGIGLLTIGKGGIQLQHLVTMNLLEKNAAHSRSAGQQGAVGIDMGWGITYVVAKVHAVVGNV